MGQAVACTAAEALAKRTKPPGRYSEGTLLRAMETAGKLVEDDEAAEAMKDAGIGTPATRAATIERLVDAEYIEREGRGLRATEKGIGLVTMLGDHVLTSPELTGRWEQRLNRIERGEEQASEFRDEIDGFTREVVAWFADKERADLRVERTPLAPCPTAGCEGQIVEYPKSYGCNTYKGKDDPGCGYTLWKQQNGHTITRDEALEHIAAGRSSKDLESEREIIGPCPTPGLRRRDRRAHAQLRLHQLEEPLRDRLRLRDLEEGARLQGGGQRRHGPPDGGARRDQRRAGGRQGADRPLRHPRLPGRDRREQPRLRLHQLEEPQEPRVRVRDLEAREGPRGDARGGDGAARGGARRGGGGHRAQGGRAHHVTPAEVAALIAERASWGYSRSSGPGGQRRDHTETRAELTRPLRRSGRAARADRRAAAELPRAWTSAPCGSPARPSARANATATW